MIPLIPLRLKLVLLIVSLSLMVLIIALVRNKKLREEYSFLWILLGLMSLVFVFWNKLPSYISKTIGISAPSNMLFLFAIIFLIILSLYFSVKTSSLTNQVKILMQRIVLLEQKLNTLIDSEKETGNVGNPKSLSK